MQICISELCARKQYLKVKEAKKLTMTGHKDIMVDIYSCTFLRKKTFHIYKILCTALYF